MKTAKELFDKMLEENDECTSTEMMIEFAKTHVTEALKQASEKACIDGNICIIKESITESYPLELIK